VTSALNLEQHIQYGKTKAHATIRLEQGVDAVPFGAKTNGAVNGKADKVVVSRAEGEAADREREKRGEMEGTKRGRDDAGEEGAPQAKKSRTDDDDDGVEMEIEDDD
jgi:U2 small nuclear ribonucleoprotein B''